MRAKLKTIMTPALPASYGERLREMKMRVISYRNEAAPVMSSAGERNEWLPRDIVAEDGKSLIVFRYKGDKANDYAFDGWDCWHDGSFGGMRNNLHSALTWIERARDVHSSAASDFRGI